MWNVGKYGEKNIWLSGYVFTTPSAAMGGGRGGMLANKSVVESENRRGSPLALSGDRCEETNFSLSFFQLIGRERRGGGRTENSHRKKWGDWLLRNSTMPRSIPPSHNRTGTDVIFNKHIYTETDVGKYLSAGENKIHCFDREVFTFSDLSPVSPIYEQARN